MYYNYVMEINNTYNLVLSELSNDKIQLEVELERLVNDSTTPTVEKVGKIKEILRLMSINNTMVGTWNGYLPSFVDNNEQNNKENE